MSTTTQPFTADELFAVPSDGFRYELVRGELRKMNPAGNEHGRVGMRLGWRLAHHVEARKLGVVFAAETGFRISTNPDTVRAPDAAFVSQKRLDEIGPTQGYWPGAPDLAVEVVSPHDTFTAVEEKAIAWLEAGTQMVLTLDPAKRTVTKYRSLADIVILNEAATLDIHEVVAGFQVVVEDLFG